MAKKDIFEEYAQLEEYASAEDISRVRAELLTCPELNTSLAGTIIELDKILQSRYSSLQAIWL